MSAVLILVEGGVADYVCTDDLIMDVQVVDYDNIAAGDEPVELDGELLALARENNPNDEGKYYYEAGTPMPKREDEE